MMRNILFIFLLVLSMVNGHAQSVNVKIIEGFKTGNPKLISPFFGSHVEMITPRNEGSFTGVQAEKKLSEFFRLHPATGFSIKHNGKSPSGSRYSIGVLNTDRGTFRIYLLFGGKDDTEINEIRIEDDE